MKHNYFFKLLIAIAFCSMGSLGFAADWYISSTGNDTSGDGSMGNPWASFSKAQAAAAAGDVIHVSGMIDFTLDPANTTNNSGTTTSNKAGIAITKNLTVQGIAATEDGFSGTNGANTTRFFQITNSSYTLTLKNLKLSNGVAQSTSNTAGGGAIMMTNGNIVAENVIFDGNSSIGYNGIQGAAIYIGGANTLGTSFKNCIFKNNVSDKAGAVYINNWAAGTASAPNVILFENCSFVGNEARNTGGSAIMARSANEYTTLNMINCTFSKNKVTTVSNGGTINMGAKGMRYMNMNFINCTISENTTVGSAGNGAGLVYLNTVQTSSTTPPTNNNIGNLYIKNTIIEKNTAASGIASDLVVNAQSPTVPETGFAATGTAWTNGIPGYIKIENSLIGQVTNPTFIPSGNITSSQVGYLNTNATDFKAFLGTFNTTKNYYPLLTTSQAIDYGASTFLSIYSNKDQLGNTRPFTNGKCHAGAVEVKAITSTGSTNVSSLSAELSDLLVSGGELYIDQGTNVNSLSIAPGAKVTVSGTNALTASNGITLESNADATATLLDNYSSPTVNATVQQYVTAGRNWYMSAPVAASGVAALSRGNSVVEWNEATKAWDTKTSGNLLAGKGYIQVAGASQGSTGTVNFSGLTNSGEISVAVSRTESGLSRGFNLVGNPYPSYLDWNDVIADSENAAAGLSSTFWYRTKNTLGAYVFTTYNGTSNEVVGGTTANTTINHLIPPMQAFWIKVNANAGNTTHSTTLKFKNTMREHGLGDNNKFKAPKQNERTRLRLRLENGSFVDETLIYFDANAADNFDSYDSPKMLNNSAITPDLYSKAGAERLVINGLSEVRHNMEIPLGFSLNAAAALKFKVSEIANLPFGTSIYLIDKEKNTQTELNAHTVYDFSTTTSTANNENRFSLLFRAPSISTDIDLSEKSTAKVFVNAANQISILAFEKCSYSIYNALGQKLESGVLGSKYESRSVSFDAGVYFVSVTVNGQNNIQKLIIR